MLRKTAQDCSTYTLSFDTTVFIIESTRRRVAVEATLENRGENAYSTVLNISQSENLQFASLIQKVGPRLLAQRTTAKGTGVTVVVLTELCSALLWGSSVGGGVYMQVALRAPSAARAGDHGYQGDCRISNNLLSHSRPHLIFL